MAPTPAAPCLPFTTSHLVRAHRGQPVSSAGVRAAWWLLRLLPLLAGFTLPGRLIAQGTAPQKLAVVRHALSLNGRIEGSAQQLTGESVNFNSGAFLGGDFLVPGLPTVNVNGSPTWQGQQTGAGAATPTGYTINVNSGVTMRYLVKRTAPVALPTVAVPPTPAGTRQVNVNTPAEANTIGNWATVRDLTLNSGAGNVTVPAGTYGVFNASNSNNTGFVFGVAGATTPSVYNLQQLTLNSHSRLTVAGPVIINVRNQVALNSNTIVFGSSSNPAWVTLNVSSAGVSVNSGAVVYGAVNAPNGRIDLNGKIVGTTASDYLTVNSGGVLQAGVAAPVNQAPTVSAGANQTITLPAAATLAGIVSDDGRPAGAAVASTWTKASGPGTVTFANAAAPATSATFSAAGTYVLTLTASDTALSASASVTITVQPANQAPVVSAGANQTVALPASATLAGSVSDDGRPAGAAVTSAWSKTSGPGSVTFANAASPTTSAAFSAPGTYVLTLSASDTVLSAAASVTVTVTPQNQPPSVSAGAAQSVTLPAAASLSGNAGDDGLPNPPAQLTLAWTKTSGPGSVTFSAPAAAATQASFSVPGAYVLRLSATDGALSSAADVTVTVAAQNQAPTVSAGSDQSVRLPAGLTLGGSASDDGLPNPPAKLTLAWTKVSGPGTATFSAPAATNTDVSFSAAGTYVLRLAAHDGALSTASEVTVTVKAANLAPVVSAGPAQTIRLPAAATLAGTITDDGVPEGSTLTQGWTKVSGPGAVTFADPAAAATAASFGEAGTYVLRLTASDTALSSSAEVTATVQAANQAPVVSVGPAQSVTLPAAANLPGTVSDDGVPEGAALSTTWSQVSGPGTATFADAAAPQTSATFSQAGTYVLRLTASDTLLSASADVTVRVTPPNQPPQVNAGPNQTVTLPGVLNLQGSAIDDGLPLNGTLALTWSQVSTTGQVSFSAPTAASAQATFSQSGTYVLRLTANDGALSASSLVTVTVLPANTTGSVTPTFNTPEDFAKGESVNLDPASPRGLQLTDKARPFHVLWVPVSSKGTVVKIDTDTGAILGEYWSAPQDQPRNPSRTTVDLNGNVWAGNRDGNSVVQIGLVENGQWADRNGDGVLRTSTGLGDILPWPNTSGADTGGGVSTAQDEAILRYVRTHSGGTRHLSITPDNDVWVSGLASREFDLIDGQTGQIKRAEPSVGHGGYGGLMDRQGVIWSARPMLRWDPAFPLTGPSGGNWRGYGHDSYGMALDSKGNVWVAAHDGNLIRKFAPDGTLIGAYPHGDHHAQGCCVDGNDDVWVAHSLYKNTVGHLKNDGTYVGKVTVGHGPTGVAVDAKGKVWATNYYGGTVSRIDPKAGPLGADGVTPVGQVDLTTVHLGGNPYNYSDMTGSTLVGIPQRGTWSVVYDGGAAGTRWGTVSWTEQIAGNGTITVTAASGEDRANFSHPVPATRNRDLGDTFPDGRYLKVSVTFTRAASGESPVLYDLSVGTKGTVFPTPTNRTPTVSAGPAQTLVLPNQTARLRGAAFDDGLPAVPAEIAYVWRKVSGPGNVTFGNAAAPVTTATLDQVGVYVLRLAASDGERTAEDDVVVTVTPPNQAPVIDVGPDLVVPATTRTAPLQAGISDDGVPAGGRLVSWWGKFSGPGQIAFDPPSYDLMASFNGDNPRGTWSFGSVLIRGGAFTPYPTPPVAYPHANGLRYWSSGVHPYGPNLYHNYSGLTQNYGNVTHPPDLLNLHPGNGNALSVVRWTCPAAGTYVIAGRFEALDASPTTTDVAVLLNGQTSLTGGFINGRGETRPFQLLQYIPAGATVDFSVGCGINENYFNDSTGLAVTITQVNPGPITQATFSLPGEYVLRAYANDGQLTGSADLRVLVQPACTPPASGLGGWWRGEGDAADALSGAPGMLSPGGATYGPGRAGRGFVLDGQQGYVRLPASAGTNVGRDGTGLTMECWINPTSVTNQQPLIEWNDTVGREGAHLWLAVPYAGGGYGSLWANVVDNYGHYHHFSTGHFVVKANALQHVALTYDKPSGVARLYHDGVVVAEQNLGTFTPRTGYSLFLGARPFGPGIYHYGGLIDEVAVYDRALSAAELQAIIGAGSAGKCADAIRDCSPVAPPAGLVSWWRAEEDGADQVGANPLGFFNNISFGPGETGEGFFFDGFSAFARATASPTLNVGPAGGFSVEGWVNPADLSGQQPLVEWNRGDAAGWGVHLWINVPYAGGGAGSLWANVPDAIGGQRWFTTPAGILTANTYQHVALTYDRASGLARLYRNGDIVAEQNLGSFVPQTATDFYVGQRPGTDQRFKGNLDELCLYNRALATSEVQGLFLARGCGKVTNPALLNRPPVVNAGPPVGTTLPAAATLAGQVSDDGLPLAAALAVNWSQLAGPGTATFANGQVANSAVSFNQPGVYTLRLSAHDGALTAYADVPVTVLPAGNPNQAPQVAAFGPPHVALAQSAPLVGQVSDDGLPGTGLTLAWTQVSGPAPATFTAPTGIETDVNFPALGTYTLRLTANDGQLAAGSDVTIKVSQTGSGNAAPSVQAGPAQSITANNPANLAGSAADDGLPQNNALTYAWTQVSGPGVATFAAPAASTTTATFTRSGVYVLQLAAADGELSGTDQTTVTVRPAPPRPPTVALAAPVAGTRIATNVPITLAATAAAATDQVLTRVEFYADGARVGSSVTAPWTTTLAANALAAGGHQFTAVATDDAGQQATSAAVHVSLVTDSGRAPLVQISNPEDADAQTAPFDVVGTANSPTLQSYTLAYRRPGEACADWVPFASGTAAVTEARLGGLDTTLLPNGLYQLRLRATDSFGRTAEDQISVVLHGDMKVGHFTLAFNDLTVPLSGVPITVTRRYDSRERCPGDFGFGWNLDVSSVRVEANMPLGDGWMGQRFGSTYALTDAGPHVVSVVFPDGKTLRFHPQVKLAGSGLSYQGFAPPHAETPLYMDLEPLPGTQGQLKVLGWPEFFYPSDDTYPGDKQFLVEPYDYFGTILSQPGGWQFTAPDGRAFTFNAQGKLTKMNDRAGNSLTFTRDGVTHSPSGKSVTFSRDGQGRIKTITDPAGKTLSYTYNAAGDLIGFFERGRNPLSDPPTAGYRYETTPAGASTHRLAGLLDAAGSAVAQNFYDAEGRLQRTVDATGKETVFTHDLATRTETITDRAGLVTTLRYDERGNVVDKTDPGGTRTQTAFHRFSDGTLSDLKTTETVTGLFTNPNGNGTQLVARTLTTRYAYEDDTPGAPVADDGRLRKVTDPLGHTTRFTYDAQGNARTVTDALGRTLADHTFYPGTSRLQTALDALGHPTAYTYDAAGNPDRETRTVTVTNALGQTAVQTLVTDQDFNADGFLIRSAEPGGRVTTYEHDALGRVRFERTARTDAAGVVHPVVTEHAYDDQGRLTRTWDAEHPRAQFPDAPTSETVYDERFPDKPAVTYDALRRATRFAYNARGELETTTSPDGKTETTLFDANGRREWSIDRRGKRTRYRYDAAGRPSETWFCDEGILDLQLLSRSEYDGAGRVWRQTDAAGVVTVSLFDDAGRRVAAVDGAGQRSRFDYDAAGRLRFVTDAKGRVTEHRYDHAGRRTTTVLPAARLWSPETASYRVVATETVTVYDELGRRAGEYEAAPVDLPLAQRRLKRFVHDGAGRLTDVVDALGQVTSYAYDEQGNQLRQTDANRHATAYAYDNLGRRVARTLPGGQAESLRYDEAGQLRFRTDFNGRTTELRYDQAGRLRFRIPDAAAFPGEPTVEWRYTASGRRERMLDGTGETVYGYNARDQLTSKATALGTLTYGRDGSGRLSGIASSTAGGGANVTYNYDGAGRLWKVTDNQRQATTTYGYDEVGNLRGVSLPNGVTSLYAYNEHNRLDTLTVSRVAGGAGVTQLAAYGYGLYAGGQRRAVAELGGRTVTYDYDGLWRLKGETVAGATGGSPNGQVGYQLDATGNRESRASTLAGLNNQGVTTFDANDRIVGAGFGYDANGNTRTSTAGSDTFDSFDRLVRRQGADGSLVEITYDGDGHKVAEAVTKSGIRTVSTFLVDEENHTGYAQAVEEKINGGLNRTYAWGHALIAQDTFNPINNSWTARFYGFDGHGSVRLLTDETGQVTDRYDYDGFGNLLARQGSSANRHLYCGEEWMESLGLYHLRARLMDPSRGGFWTADSYEGSNWEPISLHRYLYAHTNPLGYVDPSGHNATTVDLNLANAIVVSLQQTFVTLSIATYLGHYAKRDYSVWGYFGFGHSFIFIQKDSSGRGYRYDVALPDDDVIDEAKTKRFRVFDGTIEKHATRASALEGVPFPFAKFNDGHIALWENFAQLLAWDLASKPVTGPFPSKFPYRYSASNCQTWTFYAGLGATAISILPVPKPNGSYF